MSSPACHKHCHIPSLLPISLGLKGSQKTIHCSWGRLSPQRTSMVVFKSISLPFIPTLLPLGPSRLAAILWVLPHVWALLKQRTPEHRNKCGKCVVSPDSVQGRHRERPFHSPFLLQDPCPVCGQQSPAILFSDFAKLVAKIKLQHLKIKSQELDSFC
jgi:hypothetical protein